MVHHSPLETNSESRLVANSCMKVNKSHDVLVYVSEREREHYYFTQSYCHSRILKKIEIFVLQKFMMDSAFLGFEVLISLMQSTNVVKILINILYSNILHSFHIL